MTHKVCVITGTRADYGLLKELLFRLKANGSVALDLLVTGSHLSPAFGNTQDEILADGFSGFSRLPIPIENDSSSAVANATGIAICRFSEYFTHHRPELAVVLGDRYEILAAVIAARMNGIAVAHISGGDVTEGAIDDAIRHSVTKMSQIHFPGCEQSRRRIIQMGEQPGTVFNVGEPGVENCLKTDFLSRQELAESVSFDGVLSDYCIVTFHPVTMENNTGEQQVTELIRAMDSFDHMNYIVTMANADAGGRAINRLWTEAGKRRDNWLVVTSLGVRRYLSAMRFARAVIGNSSSGIVEAPSMGIPTVNIGDRQKGRMTAESVITCEPDGSSIRHAMETALDDDFREKARHVHSPFGDGTTSEKIEAHIMEYLNGNGILHQKKPFFDIDYNSGE